MKITVRSHRRATFALLPILACAPLACSGGSDAAGQDPARPPAVGDPVEVVARDGISLAPTYIKGNLGTARAAAAVESVASLLGARTSRFELASSVRDGAVHDRYTQFRNARIVLGGELVVHSRNGVIYAANGDGLGDLPAPAEAAIAISAPAAISAAVSIYAPEQYAAAGAKTELAYRRAANGKELLLVHTITVTGAQTDGTPIVDTVLVDAVSGSIVDRIPTIHTARNRELHDLKNKTSLPGATVRIEGQEPTSDSVVNTNYDRLGTTYDAYKELFGRDSLDDAGGKLISSVHYSTNYNNAYWNGRQMVYGDGDGRTFSNLANSLDVTAHELTHGVTSKTSNLTYSGESGGLNEAMSDIFGNVVEYYGAGKVVSDDTWKVGEDVYTPSTAGDALRYLNDPAKDKRSLDYYPDYSSGVDVHYSSGIANLAFYLLSQGGTHPRGKTDVKVTGIGIEKAAQVFYRANTTIFTSSTSFANAKTWTEQAAKELGYTDDEVTSVRNAWLAVGVGTE
ncbi:M4 family metallopeptidase [Pendulispora albinea]|uniref:Neutral metalloproteinase n=1 Tax=Pendulispora albinea TaxID=2741071 RepID=A0ABZ2M342_9BACT